MKKKFLLLPGIIMLFATACGLPTGTSPDGPTGHTVTLVNNTSTTTVPAIVPAPSSAGNPTSAPDSDSTTAPDTPTPTPMAIPITVSPVPSETTPGISTPLPSSDAAVNLSFLAQHGALSVDGADLTDQNGEKIQLYGVSTHGLAWFPEYVNYDSFRTLHDDWKINCVRLALYTYEYGGYSSGGDKEALKNIIRDGISYATQNDMYVIVDWHVLNDRDPNTYKEDALTFFDEITKEYASYSNIIYEICNEPNSGVIWDSIKSYANEVIPVIRANDEDAVILVGTPTWSQEIDKAAADPLDFDNVMYTLHFYADTHRDDLRSRLENCENNNLPVFISEFGTCDASGNGANNFDQTSKWMEMIEKYNLSFFCWNLSNKAESSSLISSSCSRTSDWTEDELSESGRWMRNYFRGKAK